MEHKSGVKWVLLGVYGAVSIATFYHSMWGFATLAGEPTEGASLFWWWFIGGLMAAAVDVGMGAIVYARANGDQQKWLVAALIVLALASAYTQIIYAAQHATGYTVGDVRATWKPALQAILDARVIILPIMLPAFALVYAFAAKTGEPQAQPDPQDERQDWTAELRPAQAQPVTPKEAQIDAQPETTDAQVAQGEAQPAKELPEGGAELPEWLPTLPEGPAQFRLMVRQGDVDLPEDLTGAELGSIIGKSTRTGQNWLNAVRENGKA